MSSLLQVQEVSFQYPGALILEQVGFSLNKGEIFCLLGPNGCGKTTLLDCILGWLKPHKGKISLNGTDIGDMSAKTLARQLAYVPQSHERTFPYRVREMVLMGRASYLGPMSSPSGEDMAIADEALEMVGISHLKNRPYTQLSGGEGQLVMVARALAQRSPLVVMDEPTAHLDYKHEMVILETIVDLVKQTGLSVLMATHIPNHCYYFENNGIPTRVGLLKDRHFMGIGRPCEVLTDENLGRLYNVQARIISCDLENGRQLRQVVPISTINRSKNNQGVKN
ncbi:MAG: ABC transporter ATP-binding protein [Syntrophomonadaceae bacterium]|nr:ABC transporter ATP-binding protein [Syntrophomonadaceae bacterium]